MNNLLQLKGTFEQASRNPMWAPVNLPSGKCVNMLKLEGLLKNLMDLKAYWQSQKVLSGALISVYYNKVTAKSNRIQGLLSKGSKTSNSSIVGARFTKDASPKHIITHYVSLEIVNESIARLKACIKILKLQFNSQISHNDINAINSRKGIFDSKEISKTNFLKVIVDAYYIDKFDILVDDIESKNEAIITLYDTDDNAKVILEKLGINLLSHRVMDNTTILLRPDELDLLKQKAPFLISMSVSNISELSKEDFDFGSGEQISIPAPANEPVVGVIDTLFDENVYFSEWVEFENKLPQEIPISSKDYEHGTAVSSIIVDGPTLNPRLDDNCGRFKVRHFGVANEKEFNSFSILRSILDIVTSNRDIKVWNLSLGSKLEVSSNSISPEAYILDKIQHDNDVIFVIAGTNKSSSVSIPQAIGAPADSINSLVVNSVNDKNKPASYSRKGPVLSFFIKPDVSYYGGDEKEPIKVWTSTGEAFVKGTSFAAPWISRKLAYLINVLGLSREVAKALIINSSTGWHKQKMDSMLMIGHGVVPIRIDDVVKCPEDEIQFVISGVSEKYDTYNYNIPIPVVKEKYPFIAKATLCYFPACSRNQGVDYTNTELDISFGRLTEKGIKSINNNYQTEESKYFTWEEDARRLFRKWDNIKHIREVFTGKNRVKDAYINGLWGISLKTKERLEEKYGENLKFGMVITLKEINGVNRIEEFIKNCQLRGWLVNKLDVENRIDII